MAELGDLMMKDVAVFRDRGSLESSLEKLNTLNERSANLAASGTQAYNPGWDVAIQLPGMIEMAIAIARSALKINESRGAHTRVDYPKMDLALEEVNTVATRSADGAISIRFVRRPPMPEPLASLLVGAAR